jgi:hypothetical protein
MANTQAIAASFKSEVMNGVHALGTTVVRASTAADTVKAALYLATATINASVTAYTATGEATGAGYTAGGVVVTNATAPSNDGATGYWTPSASITYSTVTLAAFDCVLLYNATQSNKAIAAYTFGSQTVNAGTFSLTMPANNGSTGLLRLA